jgi:hypothetical protein
MNMHLTPLEANFTFFFPFFLRMNKRNIKKGMQMIYERFVITPNLFWCHMFEIALVGNQF